MFTILWDNDGVLVNTEGLYFRSCQTVLHMVGIELKAEQFREISLRRGESTLKLAAEHGICDAEIEHLRGVRDRLYAESLAAESCVVQGAEDVLRSLYGQVRMGVVTGTTRRHFDLAHSHGRLTRFLDFVVTHDDYQHSKPHPEPYLTGLNAYGLRPEECIVVEDSERGLASATAAGLRCLVVLSDWTKHDDFGGACRVLNSIHEVPGAVLPRIAAG